MEKQKRLKKGLLSLLIALIVALSAVVLVLTGYSSPAYAADRYVELDGNSVFYTSIRGAGITCTEEKTVEGDDNAHRYTLFQIGEDQTVSYRQALAYSWKTGNKNDDGIYSSTDVTDHTFSMELSFENTAFKKFIIKFQSQQYVLTEDKKSENYLIFTPAEEGKVKISVAQSLEEKEGKIEEEVVDGAFTATERIKISFAEYEHGDYPLLINGAPATTAEGGKVCFKNVYRHFATYVPSGDTAVTPLTFSAEFEDNAAEKTAEMVLYDINGQSFEMHRQGNDYKIKDTAAPVICFSETPSYLEYGKAIGLKYKTIDVIASSPRSTAYYYVLTGKQYASDKFIYDKIDYSEEDKSDSTEGEGENKEEDKDAVEKVNPFIQISSSSSNIRIIRDSNTFIPSRLIDEGNVYGLVKLYYEISDVSGSNAQKDVVFVDWYAKDEALVNIYDEKNTEGVSNFLKLIDDKPGVTFAREGDETVADYEASIKAFEEAYQLKIDEAIAKLEDGKLYAGGGKFYLPAVEYDFVDDYFNYGDYKYSLYYKGKTTGSNTSLDPNQLAIDLNDADVTYKFKLFVTDSFGSPMRYPALDDSGKPVWKEITTDDVWDEDFETLLPSFTFDVAYKEATAEDPENLSLAYVDTTYNGVSFTIKGVSDTYTSQYKLYVFDRSAFYTDTGITIGYDQFKEAIAKLFNNEYENNGTKLENTRKYFTTVKVAAELLETDENYEAFKALNWNATSISFTPQSVEDFYVVELTLTDKRSQLQSKNYATVAASVQTTPLKGESDWVENNVTSIVLLSVAGVCLVALIVLLIIKPKDKGDIDTVYSEVEEKSAKSKKKNKKQN
ncbi:MAG: hypothetical protein K2O44_01140 [Clostridia bacterium]|nr:hypothetical protein [Clostridia bacterium]